jgi:hypothetical protein
VTFRAVLLGLTAAAFISGITYFNDFVLHQSHFVGSFLPTSVFGGLMIFVILINPLLGRINRSLSLRRAELAVAVAVVFAACHVPGRGLMHYFATLQMMPHYYQNQPQNITWQKGKVVQQAPKRMLADISRNSDEALGGFYQGLRKPHEHIGLADIPWYAWEDSLMFWVPLLLSILIGMIGLSVLLHQQWAHHERLRYPIATFAHALLPQHGQTSSSVLRSRIFWLAACGVMAIHSINYAHAWFPEKMIQVPTAVSFLSFGKKIPTFATDVPDVFFRRRLRLFAIE